MIGVQNRFSPNDFGVYVHIPFCRKVCHYCNFHKISTYDQSLIERYFISLRNQLEFWLSSQKLPLKNGISSVFFGGGTPSLVSPSLFVPVLDALKPFLSSSCEISLEANVDDVHVELLTSWQDIGVNRLSLGVQSFHDERLQFLKRRHDAKRARCGVSQALDFFKNINIDLIYGVPGQSENEFLSDIKLCIELGVSHLSLYCLTYESSTPLGKKLNQGRFVPMTEDDEFQMYDRARNLLLSEGYLHEEVSNFAKPGFSCRHNWLYWQGLPYLGVGSSAHGFLQLEQAIGYRFFYEQSPLEFSLLESEQNQHGIKSDDELLSDAGVTVDQRDVNSWIMEMVWCGLRTDIGVDLGKIIRISQACFSPTPSVKRGLEENILTYDYISQIIKLNPQHWFQESAWALELSLSITVGG